MDEILLAISTFPDAETARRIARELVERQLAACGNVLPQIHSVYRWQGKIESSDEALAIFKLSAKRYPEFEAKLRALHPYDVPEIVACSVAQALPEYLRWVIDSSTPENLTA
ncbi:MAG TPA: divalent-cation tolerance protein CutA [Chthoniobacterales bacterium]|jgi:periplasmic divalent cation tolerance protein|nr:divalent-cation tolerance protein CutA [Chthoniobacterales bacterium]